MTTDERLELVATFLGDALTEEEKTQARELLEMPPSQFGGGYSPSFIARRLEMYRKAEKKTA